MRYVYMVECADGSLYTGITTDVARRIVEHNTSIAGAAYTKSRRPVKLVWSCPLGSRSDASKEECRIKSLSRAKKLVMVHTHS